MLKSRLFEVWNLTQRPPQLEARFRYYEDAAGYVARQGAPRNYDIRYPDGSWSGKRISAPDPSELDLDGDDALRARMWLALSS